MRWSLRNQILIPLVAIQGIAVAAITLSTARLATSRVEHQVIDRLNGVIDTLGHANFPYTAGVLAKMRGLSGAHFVAYDEEGRMTETSFSDPAVLPTPLDTVLTVAHLDSLGESPTVSLGGTRYFATRIRPSSRPQGRSLLVLYPETVWRQARWDAAWPPLMLGVGSLGLLAAVTSWVAHRISGRIRRLEQQVAFIAGGDFREVDLGRGQDEVRDLSRSINRMCVQLREMRQTIQQSERTRILAQLAAGLAHQLRNSLTGARMSIQLHARRYPGPEGDRSLDVALRQLAMTEEHVKGLLSLGRVERRAPADFEVDRLLDDVALLVEPSCQHAKVLLERRRSGMPIELCADESGVRGAVLNLVLNAIEAAGPGGRICLEAVPEGDLVAIVVSDSGEGPPVELAEHLCEPFITSKPEGVGLGLALANQVALEHGGRLSWTCADGVTHFSLVIPRTVPSVEGASWAVS
ncbi:sensor histidine kinase [Singulisphaera acidiphila]|uniref:histidine kinase n=1 Tax=Singulisphaera acidiphila (strain ATCC BAA-1392 / DSM 18658 / VKM B-2454 / MOB10) TaxID=886293 RepID=L0DRY1_SINAD|nr:HAMP domain-containing sensor histidine kinase [Singulisphaera acidiphila]AGA31151.1 signal transduction histidine kinase [Singulisphaera acidiphila DSM 18658]